jgi:hypothetical protein
LIRIKKQVFFLFVYKRYAQEGTQFKMGMTCKESCHTEGHWKKWSCGNRNMDGEVWEKSKEEKELKICLDWNSGGPL